MEFYYILLDGTVGREKACTLLQMSFELTKGKPKKSKSAKRSEQCLSAAVFFAAAEFFSSDLSVFCHQVSMYIMKRFNGEEQCNDR